MIRFVTRSKYSHAALLFDDNTQRAFDLLKSTDLIRHLPEWKSGAVVEAWYPGGVRNVVSISASHSPQTKVDIFGINRPLDQDEETKVLTILDDEIGWPYDWKSVLRFITRHPGNLDRSWFCSELVFYVLNAAGRRLFENTQPWEVPPDWIARSPLLRFEKQVVTEGA